jgi:hypothetical protein
VTASSTQYTQPPWEFLLTASRNTLQSYELSRLSHAANLRKEITSLLDQWLAEKAAAMLARWLMEQRERSVLAPEAAPRLTPPAMARHLRPITFWRNATFRRTFRVPEPNASRAPAFSFGLRFSFLA